MEIDEHVTINVNYSDLQHSSMQRSHIQQISIYGWLGKTHGINSETWWYSPNICKLVTYGKWQGLFFTIGLGQPFCEMSWYPKLPLLHRQTVRILLGHNRMASALWCYNMLRWVTYGIFKGIRDTTDLLNYRRQWYLQMGINVHYSSICMWCIWYWWKYAGTCVSDVGKYHQLLYLEAIHCMNRMPLEL